MMTSKFCRFRQFESSQFIGSRKFNVWLHFLYADALTHMLLLQAEKGKHGDNASALLHGNFAVITHGK